MAVVPSVELASLPSPGTEPPVPGGLALEPLPTLLQADVAAMMITDMDSSTNFRKKEYARLDMGSTVLLGRIEKQHRTAGERPHASALYSFPEDDSSQALALNREISGQPTVLVSNSPSTTRTMVPAVGQLSF